MKLFALLLLFILPQRAPDIQFQVDEHWKLTNMHSTTVEVGKMISVTAKGDYIDLFLHIDSVGCDTFSFPKKASLAMQHGEYIYLADSGSIILTAIKPKLCGVFSAYCSNVVYGKHIQITNGSFKIDR